MADNSIPDASNKSLNDSIISKDEVWAKLNSLTKKVKSIELKTTELTIGRLADNDIAIADKRLSGKHCKLSRTFDADGRMIVLIEDTSSNGTHLNGTIIGKGNSKELKNGDEIMLLKECEVVDQKDEIGFIFTMIKDYSAKLKHEEQEEAKKRNENEITISKEELEKKEKQEKELKMKLSSMAEQFDCGICFMTMHQAVSLIPCMHAYCGGCFSDWLKRSKECPSCRIIVTEVKKNAIINNFIASYLDLNPQLNRDPAELAELEKLNNFSNESVNFCFNNFQYKVASQEAKLEVKPVIAQAKPQRAATPSSSESEEEEEEVVRPIRRGKVIQKAPAKKVAAKPLPAKKAAVFTQAQKKFYIRIIVTLMNQIMIVKKALMTVHHQNLQAEKLQEDIIETNFRKQIQFKIRKVVYLKDLERYQESTNANTAWKCQMIFLSVLETVNTTDVLTVTRTFHSDPNSISNATVVIVTFAVNTGNAKRIIPTLYLLFVLINIQFKPFGVHNVQLIFNQYYKNWQNKEKEQLDQITKREKILVPRVIKEFLTNHADEYEYNKLGIKGGGETFQIRNNTPICQQCANYMHSEILKKYIEIKELEKEKEEEEERKELQARNYNKIKPRRFV